MTSPTFVSPSHIRAQFSAAMSAMYKDEVPLYGTLMDMVANINRNTLHADSVLHHNLQQAQELERLDEERHGAIRVGTPEELHTIGRLFAVMGMHPVGYYDLTPAGVPVHSTAFRALHEDELRVSPFRVFTSLLRLELIEDAALREEARSILAKRNIFSPEALRLIAQCEQDGGLSADDATRFVQEALKTFSWHGESTVSSAQYKALHDQHRLIADVVAFKGPHINHLTPRTLNIDAVQRAMPEYGITPKAVIEGPPTRQHPILLRQTSFKALNEPVRFSDQKEGQQGSHTARFGEIEQRGAAVTQKGRELYDRLLNAARAELGAPPAEHNANTYTQLLHKHFEHFPDTLEHLFNNDLVYFNYLPTPQGLTKAGSFNAHTSLSTLIADGDVRLSPIVYEDFLPVSAAGIFQSNLGDASNSSYTQLSNQEIFESHLGQTVIDEQKLYAQTSARSLEQCLQALGLQP